MLRGVFFYFSGLELVLDAVLEALALDLHGGEDQTVANKVCRVADTFTRLETVTHQVHSIVQIPPVVRVMQLVCEVILN